MPEQLPAPPSNPLSAYVTAVERAVEDLRRHAATPPVNLSPITEREFAARIDEHPLENLFVLDMALQDRIVRRCRYDALVGVAEQLDAWERRGVGLSAEARERGRIAAEAFREMIFSAAEQLDVGDAWRVYAASKADDDA